MVAQLHHLRRPARRLTETEVAVVKGLLAVGAWRYRIAALFDVPQARISEIARGRRFAWVQPAF